MLYYIIDKPCQYYLILGRYLPDAVVTSLDFYKRKVI